MLSEYIISLEKLTIHRVSQGPVITSKFRHWYLEINENNRRKYVCVHIEYIIRVEKLTIHRVSKGSVSTSKFRHWYLKIYENNMIKYI